MKKLITNRFQWIIMICLVLLGVCYLPKQTVYASATTGPITIKQVDYYDENIEINNNGNNRIYFATENEAASDKWDVIKVEGGSDGFTTIDISWLSPRSENVLVFRGDVYPQEKRVTLLPQAKKLEVTIDYSNIGSLQKTDNIGNLLNIMTSEGNANDPIRFSDLQWRKGENGNWKAISLLTVAELEKLQIRGTDLYFRLRAINDDGGNGTDGRRASQAVKLKIAKKEIAQTVNVDGSKFTADIGYGEEYRIKGETKWNKVTDKSKKRTDLSEIAISKDSASNADGLTYDTHFGEMTIEVRKSATSKKAASKIEEIKINEQRVINPVNLKAGQPLVIDETDNNIYISYSGQKYVVLTIPTASVDLPYEYCVLEEDEFDLEKAKWVAVTKNTPVKISATKAKDNYHLFVRKKEIKYNKAKKVGFELASTPVSWEINYPSLPVISKASYTYIKDMPIPVTFDIILNQANKVPYETMIETIKLGSQSINFEETYPEGFDPDNPGIPITSIVLKVTLDQAQMNEMTNTTNRALYITFKNGTMDKTSIKLTIKDQTSAPSLNASVKVGTAANSTILTVTKVPTENKVFYNIGPKQEGVKIGTVLLGENNKELSADGEEVITGITVADDLYLNVYEVIYTEDEPTKYYVIKYKAIKLTNSNVK